MTPAEQLRAGRMGRRIIQLLVGLWLFGASMALMLRSHLGLDPWDVFHQGVALHVPMTIGQVTILTGVVVLLLWIPLKQWPGLGTILNVILVGLAMDATLALVPDPAAGNWAWRIALLVIGIVANGLAGGLYIGAHLGPGPRDGLMTGLAPHTRHSLRLVRTLIEVTVLAVGWLLGGTVGLGTVAYALTIGPLVQFFLPRVEVRLV